MKSGPSRKRAPRVAELAVRRTEADDRVGSRADIIGSMLGLKLKAGQSTGQYSFTYLVREKVPEDQLSPRQRVPRRLKVKDMTIPTDVVAWPRMVEQASIEPTIISDGPGQGSLSCFARTATEWLGVSCAHCLVGADGNPATPTDVRYWATAPGHWLDAGRSRYLTYAPGAGISGNFGYLDCGLVELRDAALRARAAQGTPVGAVSTIQPLLGKVLTGFSALNAPGSTSPMRRATVIGVEQAGLNELTDLVLSVDAPGTFGGDSGLLWFTQTGQAAAIHARGESMPPMQGSSLTTAMSAARVCSSLGVQLVIG
jgi:hypothetical protein